MRKLLFLAVLLLLVVPFPAVFAQTTNATLGGTVTDPTGALIPGVSITATNTQTGIVNKLLTNEAGAYQFASLQTGTYSVRAELPGFQAQTREAALGISQQVRLNFALQVGAVSTSLDVNAQAEEDSLSSTPPATAFRSATAATTLVQPLPPMSARTSLRNFALSWLRQTLKWGEAPARFKW
jgi:Carboxypeptidase regulatory-like domain